MYYIKNKFYSLLVLFLIPTLLSAQKNTRFTLSGKVTAEKTGMPLSGATIYISDLKLGTASESNGNFTLKNIPPGTYVLEVGFVGYKNVVTSISLNDNVSRDFILEQSITEESEVVVTGSSKATSIRRNPIPIVSISRTFLQQNLSTNIIDAISKVPGINAVTTGPNVAKPFIRGLGFNRILTLYDGVRQEGQQWGDEHGIEIDQNTVDRVEVVKGPASLIYGSDAVAGVINLLPPNPPPPGKTLGNITSEYQTNNGLFANSASLAGNTGSVIWMLRGSYKMATNYRNNIDGRVFGTGFRETDLSGLFGINRSWGYSHFGLSTFNDLQEIPDGSRDSASRRFTKQITEADTIRPIVTDQELSSYTINPIHQHVQHYRIYNASNFILGDARLAINLAYQKSIRQEFSHPQANVAGLYLLLNTFSYDAKYYFAEKKGLSITGGINGMYQTNNATKGTEFVIPSYHQFDAGPFIFVKKAMAKLEMAGGLRFDVRSFNNDPLYTKTDPVTGFNKPVYGRDTIGADIPFYSYQHTFTGVSGSFGLSYRFSKQFTGKFNIGRGFRAPNISEISANGVHPGTNIYQVGNLNFKPEFNLQEDVGINYSTPHVTVDAEIFNNNVSNYIFNQKILNSRGMDSVIVQGTQTFQFQAARAHLYGAELTVDIHPHPLDWLHFENSVSVVFGKNNGVNNQLKYSDSGKYLPFIPPIHSFSELRGNFKKISSFAANSFIKIQLEMYAAQTRAYLLSGTETPTPGYQLLNAGFGSDIVNLKNHTLFNISVLANNLFDIAYQSHLNRLKYFEPYLGNSTGHSGIYNMGRNISFKVNIPIGNL